MNISRRPGAVVLAAVAASLLGTLGTAGAGLAQGSIPSIYVTTTADAPLTAEEESCQDGKPCTLRLAIRTAQIEEIGAFVTACFDPAEVPDARPCPEGKLPLKKSDPGYDPVRDRWIIKINVNRPIGMTARQTFVDFRRGMGVTAWRGPQDNKVVIEATVPMEHLFALESENNILAGFEIRGAFEEAAILIKPNLRRDDARNNQIGPGVILAGITKGKGVKILGSEAFNNKVFGIWCGITGDGTVVDALEEDCIHLEQGAYGNVIGDIEQPNVLSASHTGSGLRIEQVIFPGMDFEPTRDNEIRGNWLGLDATGASSYGLETGVTFIGSPGNRIIENVISNKRGTGIRVAEAMTGTLITDNIIGGDPLGESCRGNFGYGLWFVGGPQDTRITGNRLMCNEKGGVFLQGTNTRDILLSENSITQNPGKPITLSQGANRNVRPPRLTSASRYVASGTACPDCIVEIFSDDDREAGTFEGSVTADAGGAFRFEKPEGFRGDWITATATSGKSTSELSEALKAAEVNPGRNTPTPTITPTSIGTDPTVAPATATPSASPPPPTVPSPGPARKAFLPWLGREAALPEGG